MSTDTDKKGPLVPLPAWLKDLPRRDHTADFVATRDFNMAGTPEDAKAEASDIDTRERLRLDTSRIGLGDIDSHEEIITIDEDGTVHPTKAEADSRARAEVYVDALDWEPRSLREHVIVGHEAGQRDAQQATENITLQDHAVAMDAMEHRDELRLELQDSTEEITRLTTENEAKWLAGFNERKRLTEEHIGNRNREIMRLKVDCEEQTARADDLERLWQDEASTNESIYARLRREIVKLETKHGVEMLVAERVAHVMTALADTEKTP